MIIIKEEETVASVMSKDNVCKILAEKYPRDFIRWLIRDEPKKVTILKTELSIEPIRADSVIFLQTERMILHLEFQTLAKSRPIIPFRALDYSVRLKRIHKMPVTQIVIFLQETTNPIAFTEEYVDETTTHRYTALRMWEQDSAIFLENPGLLALAPLTKTTSTITLMSQVAENVAKIVDKDTKDNIAGYTEILAGLRFEKDLIRQFLSEDIMRESVIYQDILQKGEQRTIIRQLNRRFGEIDSSLLYKVRMLTIEKLDDLADALLDFSEITDLITWLNNYEN